MSEPQLSIAQYYHERTKYDPATLMQRGRALDFSQQPQPFKEYKFGTYYDLKPYLENPEAAQSPMGRLSRLLYYSYGLTGVIPQPEQPIYLRSAPSAGGLYPAEVYLVAREDAMLPPGLYNYQVNTHSLCHFWSDHVWSPFEESCLWHPALRATHLALVMTAVFYRSAWRYEDRAYRRIFLDSGHLLGNIELTAALNDYRAHCIGGFLDESLSRLLYVDSEKEGAICAIALADLLKVDQNLPPTQTALPSPITTDYPAIADGALLSSLHQATQILTAQTTYTNDVPSPAYQDKYNFPFCQKIPTQSPPIDWGPTGQGLAETLHTRRSTRQYTGAAISLEDLTALLDFTYHPQHYAEQALEGHSGFFDLSLIETFIAVSDINGLEAGCYYYAVHAQELRQVRFKQFRSELHYLCLQQELGRDAAALVFHTADLKAAVARYGDRAYRYLHLDAGHLGQRLNLAAIRLHLGVSGIGGFFDDQVNDVLGLPADEAVLYITTLGQPSRRR
jgi:SagB-type dehydrogenase family enzyme